jgi:hypothetical protein
MLALEQPCNWRVPPGEEVRERAPSASFDLRESCRIIPGVADPARAIGRDCERLRGTSKRRSGGGTGQRGAALFSGSNGGLNIRRQSLHRNNWIRVDPCCGLGRCWVFVLPHEGQRGVGAATAPSSCISHAQRASGSFAGTVGVWAMKNGRLQKSQTSPAVPASSWASARRGGGSANAELAGRIAVESEDLVARHTLDGAFVLPLAMNVCDCAPVGSGRHCCGCRLRR